MDRPAERRPLTTDQILQDALVRELRRRLAKALAERDRARSLACRLQAEYEQVAGAWGSGSLARDCADQELATYGITLSTGPGHRQTHGTPFLTSAPRATAVAP